jgi:hypothetical protein
MLSGNNYRKFTKHSLRAWSQVVTLPLSLTHWKRSNAVLRANQQDTERCHMKASSKDIKFISPHHPPPRSSSSLFFLSFKSWNNCSTLQDTWSKTLTLLQDYAKESLLHMLPS